MWRERRSALLALALVGCTAGDKVTCGDGTAEVDGACVAVDSDAITCGEGTHEDAGACVADAVDVVDCGEGTHLEGDACVPDPEGDYRGYYAPPLVWLQKQLGQGGALGTGGAGQNHMHVSEFIYREAAADRPAELFYCSYTFGVLNATNPQSMSFMAQGFTHYPNGYPATPLTGTKSPGCVNMTLDDDDPNIVYVSHHGTITDGDAFIATWDIHSVAPDPAKPTSVVLAPTQGPMTSELDGTSYEGMDFERGYLWVALHDEGLGVFQRDPATDVITRVTTFTDVLVNAWEPRVIGDTAYVADGPGGLAVLDVSDPMDIQLLGRATFPGVAHDITVDGDVAYIAAEGGGLVIVDVSDKQDPQVLSITDTPGSAIAVDYDAGRVYLAAWNDARVYDVADPAHPAIIGAARLTVSKAYTGDGGDRPSITDRVLGVAGKGDYLFDGTWWTPNSFQIHAERTAPYIFLPENLSFLTFPGDVPAGGHSEQVIEVRNDGNEPLSVYDIWADNPTFTVDPPSLLIPPGQVATVSVMFTPGEVIQEERSLLHFASDDPSQPLRDGYMVGNPTGVGVGDPMPETTATLLGQYSGEEWSSSQELGNVLLLGYWATF